MAQLEQLQRGIQVYGIVPHQTVTLVDVEWSGSNAVTVVYRRSDGKVGDTLLYRENEAELVIVLVLSDLVVERRSAEAQLT